MFRQVQIYKAVSLAMSSLQSAWCVFTYAYSDKLQFIHIFPGKLIPHQPAPPVIFSLENFRPGTKDYIEGFRGSEFFTRINHI